MNSAAVRTEFCALLLLGCAVPPVYGIAAESSQNDASYAGLQGEVLLDNARVLVQRFIVQPGQSTGRQGHPAAGGWAVGPVSAETRGDQPAGVASGQPRGRDALQPASSVTSA
jgi:hypothetical protein